MKPSKSYLRREMRGYLVTVPDAAEQELPVEPENEETAQPSK